MTSFLATAIAAAAGLATAAVSAEPRPAPSASTTKAAPAAQPDRRVCVQYEITGSYLPQRTCKMLSEWKKDGVDPTARQ